MMVTECLPIPSYEAEIEQIVKLGGEIENYQRRWRNQSWVGAILDRRELDNNAGMTIKSSARKYGVTKMHFDDLGFDRLYGYDLFEVTEEEYHHKHFPDGGRRIESPLIVKYYPGDARTLPQFKVLHTQDTGGFGLHGMELSEYDKASLASNKIRAMAHDERQRVVEGILLVCKTESEPVELAFRTWKEPAFVTYYLHGCTLTNFLAGDFKTRQYNTTGRSYDDETESMHQLEADYKQLHSKFMGLPWVKSVQQQKIVDDTAGIPDEGRVYYVPHLHRYQGLYPSALLGYTLVDTDEVTYMNQHFIAGSRVYSTSE